MSNQEPQPPLPPRAEYDQILKGNVCIKKLSKHKYRITFSKIGKFLVYQVWDKDNVGDQNSKRRVFYLLAKTWINDFIQRNRDLEENGKPLFTPTTIIETVDEEQYACVIHKAYFNSHDRAVFTISTKEIQLSNNCSKKLIQIPLGKFNNVRFDIDSFWNDYIDEEPAGLVNRDAINGPMCWTGGQIKGLQKISFSSWFYINADMSKYDSKFYFIDSNNNNYKWVYTCASYGQLFD